MREPGPAQEPGKRGRMGGNAAGLQQSPGKLRHRQVRLLLYRGDKEVQGWSDSGPLPAGRPVLRAVGSPCSVARAAQRTAELALTAKR